MSKKENKIQSKIEDVTQQSEIARKELQALLNDQKAVNNALAELNSHSKETATIWGLGLAKLTKARSRRLPVCVLCERFVR